MPWKIVITGVDHTAYGNVLKTGFVWKHDPTETVKYACPSCWHFVHKLE